MNDRITPAELIQRMKTNLKNIDEDLAPKHLDANDPAAMKEMSRETDEVFSARVSFFHDEVRQKSGIRDNNWEYAVLQRRKQALVNLYAEAEERFAGKYPELSIADELLYFNAPLAGATFRSLNNECDIELAAAIWILDYLKTNDLYEEAVGFFPTTREQIGSVYLPMLSDAFHSDDELKSMLYLIRNRNRGRSGFDETAAFCDEADTGLKKENGRELPDRANFDAVMALIDREDIRKVQEEFTGLLWEWFDALLSVTAKVKREQLQKKKELRGVTAALLEQYEQAQVDLSAATVTVSANHERLQELIGDHRSLPGILSKTEDTAAAADRLAAEIQQNVSLTEALYSLVLMIPGWVNGDVPADAPMEIYRELPLPKLNNPYDICFAFLSLLDENSDLVWLYNLCYDVVAFAGLSLPWADSHVVDPDGELSELQIDYAYLKSLVDKEPHWTEDVATDQLYERCIPSPLLKERRVNTSIAKLAFLTSGLIPPRSGFSISFTKVLLDETDFSQDAKDMLYNYFALAYSVNHKGLDFVTSDDEQVAEELSQEKEGTDARDRDAEIKKLRAEIKHLKNIVNQGEHRNRDLTRELSDQQRRLEQANAELAELRSMIRESCTSEEESPTTVSFPYTVNRRTVVIGGHESWVKAMKPLLNNVRFIGASEQPNTGVIRSAEVVWIQANAMGHSSFYKIIDIIRKNDIKVCYFKYSGAEKCAEQLALEDAETEEIE